MKPLNFGKTFIALASVLLMFLVAHDPLRAQSSSPQPNFEGKYVADDYAYGGFGNNNPNALVVDTGGSGTGTQSYTLKVNAFITLPRSGRIFMPLNVDAPIFIDSEPVTPTGVSCSTPSLPGTCTFTASVTNVHGPGSRISSATFGLQEAINDAFLSGGGVVVIDALWTQGGGTNAMIAAATPYQKVLVEDHRFGLGTFTPTQATATLLAAPATLTATTVGFGINGANTTGGTYTGTSTYHYCIAYVDILGNEGPCSADFSAATAGTGATNQIGFSAPAASAGAVGYTAYISLASGTYNLTYQVPLTSSTCTLTAIETITPACAVTNATYGQTGSSLIVSALTVNTAPLHLLATTASTTSAYIGTPSGRTSYAYAPHPAYASGFGLTTVQQAYAISVAAATTVPEVIATMPVNIGIMNQVGRTIRVCGQATMASAGSTATVQNFEILWDAAGSDTAGAPVIIGQLQLTATLVTGNADNWSFCWDGTTTVAGAGVTAGSIIPAGGWLASTYGAGVLGNTGVDVKAAATGSLNLAGTGGNTQRIHIVWLHTTGTDANGITMQGLTAQLL